MAKTKKQEPSVDNGYHVTLEVNAGDVYTSEGATAQEALSALDLDYTKVKTKGVFTLSHGGKKSSKLFYLPLLRRIVVNKLRRIQVGKDLEFLLK